MALVSFTFGCGQGATKAMIACIEAGVLDKDYCRVVNSTIKDVPAEYQRDAIIISDDPNAGCGKVREAAKVLMNDYIKNNQGIFDELISEDVDYVNILATSEGASGSGSSVVLAQYIKKQLEIPVIVTLISGFENDTRGLQNTINYFRDLNGGNFTVNTISNKRFLKEANNNTFIAEGMANESIVNDFRILNADGIIDSDQNIDDTDHYKLITNPGLMFRGEVLFTDRIKNKDQFNKLIGDMIDETTSLDFDASATKVGIFMNLSDSTLAVIDTSFDSVKKKLCSAVIPEFFIHKQYDGKQEFVRIIASGMNLPKQEISDMYEKYKKAVEMVNASKDDFFDALDNMDTVNSVTIERDHSTNDNSFFDQFEDTTASEEASSVLGRNKRKRFGASSGKTSNIESESRSDEASAKKEKSNKFSTKKTEPFSEDTINKY